MKEEHHTETVMAVQRFYEAKTPKRFVHHFGRSRSWLYKWVSRYTPEDPAWCEDRSRQPLTSPHRTPAEIEEIVEMVRLSLYNKGLFCGDQAIQWELEEMAVRPLPSLSNRFSPARLTHRRTGADTNRRGRRIPHSQRWCPTRPIRWIWSVPVI